MLQLNLSNKDLLVIIHHKDCEVLHTATVPFMSHKLAKQYMRSLCKENKRMPEMALPGLYNVEYPDQVNAGTVFAFAETFDEANCIITEQIQSIEEA